jgi:hypothetical protein
MLKEQATDLAALAVLSVPTFVYQFDADEIHFLGYKDPVNFF